jgi:hypothetical protein
LNTGREQDPLIRIAGRSPVEVCEKLDLQPAARALLAAAPAPATFLGSLIQKELFSDAVAYLAHALPKADAVAWASGCVALGRTLSVAGQAAVAAAEAWSRQPTEANCRTAERAAADSDDDAARFAALAAFWSGDSLAPPDLPPALPPPELTGTAVVAALAIAASLAEPPEIPERYRNFLSRGILIARTPV